MIINNIAKLKNRKEVLDEILKDLYSLKSSIPAKHTYALEENIIFFESLYSVKKYLNWLLFRMKKIEGNKLLELSDFGFPHWQRILQNELLEIEKWKIPDILGSLRNEILIHITKYSFQEKPLVLLNVGSGAMEVERQVLVHLIKKKNKQRIIFLGFDNSQESLNSARENLESLKINILQIKISRITSIESLQQIAKNNIYTVILIEGDAFSLLDSFKEKSIDLIYHSKFKHHLPSSLKQQFDNLLMKLSNHVIESDDFNGLYLVLFSLFLHWKKPVLMNGAVFSCLRVPTKQMLKRDFSNNWQTHVLPVGGYTRVYNGENLEQKLMLLNGIKGHFERMKINNFEINYLTSGSGNPLLLIHGANIGLGQWYPNITAFSKHFTVYALDLPGSGNSTKIDFENLEFQHDMIDTVEGFIKNKRLKNITVVGHSFGACIALNLAIKLKLKSLVLLNPIGFTPSIPKKYILLCFTQFAKFISRTVMSPTRKHMKDFLLSVLYKKENLQETFIDYYYQSVIREKISHPLLLMNRQLTPFRFRSEFIIVKDLLQVTCPTLIIAGENDPLIIFQKCYDNFRKINNVTIKLFKKTGHVVNIERYDQFNKTVIEFLNKQ